MRAAALAPSRIPAPNTVDCSKLSPWLAESRGGPSLGRRAKDGPDSATPFFRDFSARRSSGAILRQSEQSSTSLGRGKTGRLPNSSRECSSPSPVAHYLNPTDTGAICPDAARAISAALNRVNPPEKSAGLRGRWARRLSRPEET
jgi:hypothetical protein